MFSPTQHSTIALGIVVDVSSITPLQHVLLVLDSQHSHSTMELWVQVTDQHSIIPMWSHSQCSSVIYIVYHIPHYLKMMMMNSQIPSQPSSYPQLITLSSSTTIPQSSIYPYLIHPIILIHPNTPNRTNYPQALMLVVVPNTSYGIHNYTYHITITIHHPMVSYSNISYTPNSPSVPPIPPD